MNCDRDDLDKNACDMNDDRQTNDPDDEYANAGALQDTDLDWDDDSDESDDATGGAMNDELDVAVNGEPDVTELRQRLADAHARIEQLENALIELSNGVGQPTSSSGAGQPTDTDGAEDTGSRASKDGDGSADNGSLLLDRESKLFSEAYFNVALDARLAAAKRHLRPVSVALIEMSEGSGSDRTRIPPLRGADAIRDTLRDADTACRLAGGMFALILEDTPENGAVWTVERIRRNLISRFGPHTMWAGVACYPAHAFSAAELLVQARAALSAAKDWNQDRIEVAIAE